MSDIQGLMEPRSVAVIGASATPYSIGNTIVKNLINLKYKGRLYPVNPKYRWVEGLKCYRSVLDIEDDVDVAVVAVPARIVPKVMEEAGRRGVRYAVIIASGFGELGDEGGRLQERIMEISRRYGIRIVGPNTTGILNLENGFTSTFVLLSPGTKPGNVSFVAQTGVFSASMMRWILTGENFKLNKVIGLGNKADVDDADALAYLKDDVNTDVILIYMEGLRRAREFFRMASKTTRIKPIIIVKANRTSLGARASLSHTGSLSVSDDIFDGLCRQAGIIRVNDFEEAFDVVKLLSFYGRLEGGDIGVASYSGAECVMAADAVEEFSLKLAKLSERTLERIEANAPPFWPKGHPVDLGPMLESDDPTRGLLEALEALLDEPKIEILMIVLPVMAVGEGDMMQFGAIESGILSEQILNLKRKHPDKKIVMVLDGSKNGIDEAKKLLEAEGIPVYQTIRRAARAVSLGLWWSRKSVGNYKG